VFKEIRTKFLLVSFTSDWLLPSGTGRGDICGPCGAGCRRYTGNSTSRTATTTFLVYNNTIGNVLIGFLESEAEEYITG